MTMVRAIMKLFCNVIGELFFNEYFFCNDFIVTKAGICELSRCIKMNISLVRKR